MFVLPLIRRKWCRGAALLFGVATLLSACYAERDDALTPREVECVGCHGQNGSAAPPLGVWLAGSQSATSARGVGAHRSHLRDDGAITKAVACSACHVVPERVDDEGHMDSPLPAELTFSGRALLADAKPSWDGTRCSNVYCHGATLSGGKASAPQWTIVDGTQSRCDSCHGAPPPAPHPQVAACWGCHGAVVGTDGRIADRARHIDGVLDVDKNPACNACHGSELNNAPPRDTHGSTARTSRGVGAHQAHVVANDRHGAIACVVCHVVPTALDSAGHIDGDGVAEVVFGPIALGSLATPPAALTPTYNAANALRCANTWCHGRDGGGDPAPTWTSTRRMVCGSCHGLPPTTTHSGQPHPPAALSECTNCHKSVIDSSGTIVSADKHVNGVVDF
ncbi:MAG: CxxxxCH/CxxCH domain-containing protein [Myxococcales bacterium]|nr:CxxxxCH/CxxCH domain-containing protein [Myxococcales bacterium]